MRLEVVSTPESRAGYYIDSDRLISELGPSAATQKVPQSWGRGTCLSNFVKCKVLDPKFEGTQSGKWA
jgi:hypothetical protein